MIVQYKANDGRYYNTAEEAEQADTANISLIDWIMVHEQGLNKIPKVHGINIRSLAISIALYPERWASLIQDVCKIEAERGIEIITNTGVGKEQTEECLEKQTIREEIREEIKEVLQSAPTNSLPLGELTIKCFKPRTRFALFIMRFLIKIKLIDECL